MSQSTFVRTVKHPTKELYLRKYTKKAFYKKHWTEETINARGHVTDANGRLLSCPFPKIFNLDEVEQTSYAEVIARLVDHPEDIELTKKYNGHLAILFHDGEEWINTTSGSFEHDFITPDRELINQTLPPGVLNGLPTSWTIMFEIVGAHDEHLLTRHHMNEIGGEGAMVIGVNNRDTETPVPTASWIQSLYALGVESRFLPFLMTVKASMYIKEMDPDDVLGWLDEMQALEETEGLVLMDRTDGWRCKIKSDWFFRNRYIYRFVKGNLRPIFIEHGEGDEAYEILPEELYMLYGVVLDLFILHKQAREEEIQGMLEEASDEPEGGRVEAEDTDMVRLYLRKLAGKDTEHEYDKALREEFWAVYHDALNEIFDSI